MTDDNEEKVRSHSDSTRARQREKIPNAKIKYLLLSVDSHLLQHKKLECLKRTAFGRTKDTKMYTKKRVKI